MQIAGAVLEEVGRPAPFAASRPRRPPLEQLVPDRPELGVALRQLATS